MSAPSNVRENALKALNQELGIILFHLNSNDSGRIAETMFQLLGPLQFEALTMLVVGHEKEPMVMGFLCEIVVSIAQKIGLIISDPSMLNTAMASVVALISCEHLRRSNHMEYVWVKNIFKPESDGYSQLTKMGKGVAQEALLRAFDSKSIQ